jgi:hypothetical protein
LRERAEENAKRRAGQTSQRRKTDILAQEHEEEDQDSLRIGRGAKLRERSGNARMKDARLNTPAKRRKRDV